MFLFPVVLSCYVKVYWLVLIDGLSRFWLHLCVEFNKQVVQQSFGPQWSFSGNPQWSLADLCAEYMKLIG